jgi:hypothetical protein
MRWSATTLGDSELDISGFSKVVIIVSDVCYIEWWCGRTAHDEVSGYYFFALKMRVMSLSMFTPCVFFDDDEVYTQRLGSQLVLILEF